MLPVTKAFISPMSASGDIILCCRMYICLPTYAHVLVLQEGPCTMGHTAGIKLTELGLSCSC